MEIPRLPIFLNPNCLDSISHPKDIRLRASLTEKFKITVAEDINSKNTAGAYAFNVKLMRVFGEPRTVFYTFDFIVLPQYRNQAISGMFFENLDQSVSDKSNHIPLGLNSSPIVFGSSLKTNSPMKKSAGKINLFNYSDQRQFAWRVERFAEIDPLPGFSIRIWEESNIDLIKMRWDNAFKNYNFTPFDFRDLLVHNRQYCLDTYVATLRSRNSDKISEASISVWDQDLLFTMKNKSGVPLKHRQLYCCYAIGEHGDLLFQHLLRHVHNEQFKQGVSYLFCGFSLNDPITKHFPLFEGIKNLDFDSYLRVDSPEEMESFRKAINEKNIPCFNDPRSLITSITLNQRCFTTTTTSSDRKPQKINIENSSLRFDTKYRPNKGDVLLEGIKTDGTSLRWYDDVGYKYDENLKGYLPLLDNREMQTPNARKLVVPTKELAMAIASEWLTQGKYVKPSLLPLTQTVCTCIDLIPASRTKAVNELLGHLNTDPVCNRESSPGKLLNMQSQFLDPLHKFASDYYGIPFTISYGLDLSKHDSTLIERVKKHLDLMNSWEIVCFQLLTSSSKSFLISLNLYYGNIKLDDLYKTIAIEEELQTETWGKIPFGHDLTEFETHNEIAPPLFILRNLKPIPTPQI
eukprot:gene5773-7183_t